VTRPVPPLTGDERPMLAVWLDYQRATLLWKCEGTEGAALAHRSVPPSSLSLLGLVRHMAIVEWWWFDHIFTASASAQPITTADDVDVGFDDLDAARAMENIDLFRHQCDVSRGIAAAAESLDVLSASKEKPTVSLRWIMIHMIEEYARHNGHADLLREQIDGAVGE
jgi:hypothetical protein